MLYQLSYTHHAKRPAYRRPRSGDNRT
ncbi:hypothetical protein BN12_20034 [Nostocoides japonicum T1-X7]|uniref:Uncharacterized protein n=1 Tax=Nostocoides japonicum T1-X7 TaxID=1194083 RepID=A0A077LUZ6_9MICO|nr:hypothetical protein BN12_20034 [Tetrasphaera japonica T1-X7]